MRRREFITLVGGLAVTRPPVARAQQRPAGIGLLGSGAAQSSGFLVDAFKRGLSDHGLSEGRDYVLDVRWAEGDYSRFPALARALVETKPAAILATTVAAVRAVQRASATIPIVMATINDPVGAGLVTSLGHPGGNTTGTANLTEDVTPKLLEILRAIIPHATVVAVLFNPANPSNRSMLDNILARAGAFGFTIQPAELNSPAELDALFDQIVQRRPEALLVVNDAAILDLRERILMLAVHHRLPTLSSYPEFTDAGALAGYGPSRLELYRRSAYYVKRILDGVRPADLPVEQPIRMSYPSI